jgi:transmembrane sensor
VGFRVPKTKGMLRREAARWLARLQNDRDPDIEHAFRRWHDSDSRHAAAFDRIQRSYEQAGLLRQSPLAHRVELQPAAQKPEWRPWPALAAAAAIVVLVPVAVLLVRNGGLLSQGTEALMLMTSVGEIKQVELADGSKVTLDTSTKVEVQVGRSHRSAHLRYGRARFRIVEASVPFVVETASATITARQGVIDVERHGRQDRVHVLSGAADVRGRDRGQGPVAVGAGEAVTMNSPGPDRTSGAAPNPDWTHGMLQFDGTPLAEAVQLANRYSERHIILAGDLDQLRITGAFHAGDTAGFARAVAAAFDLSVRQRSGGSLVLSRRGDRVSD